MNIVIASGKGGTGKTTVAVNLAHYLGASLKKKVRLFDCDVEAPNDQIFVKAKISNSFEVTVPRPIWNQQSCNNCGKCVSVCQYNAIAQVKDQILIFEELCHSCGACSYLCPEKSLIEQQKSIGKIETAFEHSPFSFVQGELNIGESLSPKIISKLKTLVVKDQINIFDAPPGTTCPVVKSMEDMDYCILVTEPTPFGLHDLKLASNLASKLQIPTGIVINRSYQDDAIIEQFAQRSQIPILGTIPFNKKYAESYSNGNILLEKYNELIQVFSKVFSKLTTKAKVPKEINEKFPLTNNEYSFKVNQPTQQSINEIVVISGKGGTGKTTITAALCEMLDDLIIADNDVDASNMQLMHKPKILNTQDFIGAKTYIIDQDKCIKCGKCQQICRFEAISNYFINPLSCEGCSFCAQVCPQDAIFEKDSISGKWFISETKIAHLSHASLGIGEENSGKLVAQVRNNARLVAATNCTSKILSDGPPGIGCPVISSITGTDLVIIVTEPTLSGVHDLEKTINLTKHFNIPAMVVINKHDINPQISDKIIHLSNEKECKVIGKIPFDKNVYDAVLKGQTIANLGTSIAFHELQKISQKIQQALYK